MGNAGITVFVYDQRSLRLENRSFLAFEARKERKMLSVVWNREQAAVHKQCFEAKPGCPVVCLRLWELFSSPCSGALPQGTLDCHCVSVADWALRRFLRRLLLHVDVGLQAAPSSSLTVPFMSAVLPLLAHSTALSSKDTYTVILATAIFLCAATVLASWPLKATNHLIP